VGAECCALFQFGAAMRTNHNRPMRHPERR
jgi:hypothetical protein